MGQGLDKVSCDSPNAGPRAYWASPSSETVYSHHNLPLGGENIFDDSHVTPQRPNFETVVRGSITPS